MANLWLKRRPELVMVLLATLGVCLIHWQRAQLAASFQRLSSRHDTFVLPPPEQTVVMSLGYRSAAADLIYGHLLVSSGLHIQEKRLAEFVDKYLDAVNALDPKFRAPYRYADAIITLQSVEPPEQFYRDASRIQRRGLKELPYDQELWSTAGQYHAYIAAQRLKDPNEQQEYRRLGATFLTRACELLGSNENIPYHCITAARLLSEDGKADAARQFLQRVLTLSDDPEIQKMAGRYLEHLQGQRARSDMNRVQQAFNEAWKGDLAFSARVEMQALGPRFDTAACAGRGRALGDACATSWADWHHQLAEKAH